MRSYYFPAFLDLRGRECVVVGAGGVALGKVLGLLPCGAAVRVVSPEAEPGVAALAARGKVRWEARGYRRGDLAGAALVVAGTDDPATNAAVYEEAVAERALVNVVDVPELCGFVYGAVFRRGRLMAAVSTGGASPAFAARCKRELAAVWGSEHGRLVSAYRRLRPFVAERVPTVEGRKRLWQEAVRSDAALADLRAGARTAEVDARLRAWVEAWAAAQGFAAGPDGRPAVSRVAAGSA